MPAGAQTPRIYPVNYSLRPKLSMNNAAYGALYVYAIANFQPPRLSHYSAPGIEKRKEGVEGDAGSLRPM
eukprot:270302-Hanusia_phi.AAC.3